MRQNSKRTSHWIGLNHQNRIPSRWVAFDTESRRQRTALGEIQTWKMGAVKRWRTDLVRPVPEPVEFFDDPVELWQYIMEWCKPKTRTVVWAHNLGYDVRIAQMMEILPELGWRMDWCNMGSNVSTMTWRSERGTLTFADLYTWLPMPLKDVGDLVGLPKLDMPNSHSGKPAWQLYAARDVEILAQAVKEIVAFIKSEDLGNWQPTGAGQAFATWRHKFLTEKVLVHDSEPALAAERMAMHTGRAEAWKHGRLKRGYWVEVDLKQAYVRIAQRHELPSKLRFHNGAITLHQYNELKRRFAVLARVQVHTSVPCVPVYHRGRTIWPVGEFTTWLWDCELDSAIAHAERVDIREVYVYSRAPILRDWATWVLEVQERGDDEASPAVRKWIKHSGRTLVGRIALRTSQWAVWGSNPEGEAGISYEVDADTGRVYRLMHAGDRTLREEARQEGHDSLPQVTGYIMAMCRVWLWEAILAAGEKNVAHVDTDCVLVNQAGLDAMREHYGERFAEMWQTKGSYENLTIYGPRNYRADRQRNLTGVPKNAEETLTNRFVGESWSSVAGDLSARRKGSVTITDKTWNVSTKDPRRNGVGGDRSDTKPIRLDQSSNDSSVAGVLGTSGS